jgi:cysteine desulfurase
MRVYFDNAATTPLSKEVLDSMQPYFENKFGNPSAIHSYGRETRAAIEKSRKTIASILNCSAGEIFFTSGGTEANNMAIQSVINSLNVKNIITSPVEHHCVLHTTEAMEKYDKAKVYSLKVNNKGQIDLQELEKHLQEIEAPVLVSIMHANNEIASRNNLEGIGAVCKKHKAIFHSDTVQTMAHYRFDLQKLPIDLLSGSAHKFHGPKGIGFIYIRDTIKINPFIFGGSQERNMRAGTENVYGIVGLAKAMELNYAQLDETTNYIRNLKNYMIEKLRDEFPEVLFNGDLSDDSLYTVLNISFPYSENASMLLYNLDINAICVSSGSACTSGSEKGSHVLEAIGVGNDRVSIRFSFSKMNTKDEIDFTISKLKELIPVNASSSVST